MGMENKKMEMRFKQKLRTLIGSVTHTQNIADQAKELAEAYMTAAQINDSDACRVIENVSCACEEALQVLIDELSKEHALISVSDEENKK